MLTEAKWNAKFFNSFSKILQPQKISFRLTIVNWKIEKNLPITKVVNWSLIIRLNGLLFSFNGSPTIEFGLT